MGVQLESLCSRLRFDVVKTRSVVQLLAFSLSFLSSAPPSLLEDVYMSFLEVFWAGRLWTRRAAGFFVHAMVGGGRGVAGPKELMGLGGAVTDRRAKLCLPPVPRQTARRLSKKTDGRFKKYYISG